MKKPSFKPFANKMGSFLEKRFFSNSRYMYYTHYFSGIDSWNLSQQPKGNELMKASNAWHISMFSSNDIFISPFISSYQCLSY